MINTERELENILCSDIDYLKGTLENTFDLDNVEFVGRQVRIGNDNICDLVFISCVEETIPDNKKITHKDIIIVELKNRKLKCHDLAQLKRYMCILEEKDNYKNFENVYGCFISDGCDEEMKNICKKEDNIKFLKTHYTLTLSEEGYSYNDEYLDGLEYDERLKKYMIEDSEEA